MLSVHLSVVMMLSLISFALVSCQADSVYHRYQIFLTRSLVLAHELVPWHCHPFIPNSQESLLFLRCWSHFSETYSDHISLSKLYSKSLSFYSAFYICFHSITFMHTIYSFSISAIQQSQ